MTGLYEAADDIAVKTFGKKGIVKLSGEEKGIAQRRGEAKGRRKATSAKAAARAAIKPLPTEDKAGARKAAGRRRSQRQGRASTILSERETLG